MAHLTVSAGRHSDMNSGIVSVYLVTLPPVITTPVSFNYPCSLSKIELESLEVTVHVFQLYSSAPSSNYSVFH